MIEMETDLKRPFIKNVKVGAQLAWKSLSVEVEVKEKASKVILSNLSGVAQPGQLIAIMGSSGAGKTTLLNALANQNMGNLKMSGSVCINGEDATKSIQHYSAYVQQHDMFYGAMTCREHLTFHANIRGLKNPKARIDHVVEEMGLQACIDSKIGTPGRGKTISGGEMKRLSFATQILMEPPLLFCDEPTSGLDSYLANQVVSSLQKIANSGTTVLCTIHQPSSETFSMFDNLLLLAKGRVCYMGTTSNALVYFEKTLGRKCPSDFNPADHYIKETSIVPGAKEESEQRIVEMSDDFEQSEIYKSLVAAISTKQSETSLPPKFETTGIFNQIYWCFWRSLIINFRDPMVVLIKVAITLVIAVVFGVIYYRDEAKPYRGMSMSCNATTPKPSADIMNLNGAIFISLANQSFSNVFAVVGVFPFLIPIWRMEHYAGLYKMQFAFLASNLSELPVTLLLPFAYAGVTYWMYGLEPTFRHFLVHYAVLELVAQCALSFGYMLSTFSENQQIINALAAPLVIPLLIFGGFYLNAESVPSYLVWLQKLSWFNYGNEALLINQWKGQKLACSLCNTTDMLLTTIEFEKCPLPMQWTGESIIKQVGFSPDNFWADIKQLVGLAILFRVIAFLVLTWKFRASNR